MEETNTIKQLSVKEMLIDSYNKHLSNFVKQLVELKYLETRPLDEVVFTLIQQGSQPGLPVERKVKNKDAQLNTKPNFELEKSILKIIQRLIEEENKKETKFN